MSLILEALRKSEAERQIGRAPGLMSPTIRVTRARGPNPWWGVLALAIALGSGAIWWVRTQTPARESAAVPAASQEPTPAPVQAPVPTPPVAPDTSAPAALPPVPPAVPVRVQPPTPALAGDAVPAATEADAILPRDPEFDSVERESVPVAVQAAPIAPQRSPPPEVIAMPAPAPLPAVDATPAAAEPTLESLPRVDELMPDVRNALPALKLTMHAYAAQPGTRFVLIDGRRYAQGDRIGPSLVVSEIRRDGAVLDFGGRRFLLPRP